MRKKGFTLIELLVVIAIIALLLSILMPALHKVKAMAMQISSTSNLRSLTLCWYLYAEDNDGKLVSGQVYPSLATSTTPLGSRPNGWRDFDWVRCVDPSGPGSDHEKEIEGIRQGALWSYVESEKVYHSPGDRTFKSAQTPYTMFSSPFRSYAISDSMAGCWRGNEQLCYHKISKIKTPSSRMVFTEEEDNNGVNWGSWGLGSGTNSWWDPLAAWYKGGTTSIFGFADGHADKRVWVNQGTKDWIKTKITTGYTPPATELEDIKYIQNAVHHDFY
jgi:prepilin-type N-terminal cleavage/methylation domain-containing protein